MQIFFCTVINIIRTYFNILFAKWEISRKIFVPFDEISVDGGPELHVIYYVVTKSPMDVSMPISCHPDSYFRHLRLSSSMNHVTMANDFSDRVVSRCGGLQLRISWKN